MQAEAGSGSTCIAGCLLGRLHTLIGRILGELNSFIALCSEQEEKQLTTLEEILVDIIHHNREQCNHIETDENISKNHLMWQVAEMGWLKQK